MESPQKAFPANQWFAGKAFWVFLEQLKKVFSNAFRLNSFFAGPAFAGGNVASFGSAGHVCFPDLPILTAARGTTQRTRAIPEPTTRLPTRFFRRRGPCSECCRFHPHRLPPTPGSVGQSVPAPNPKDKKSGCLKHTNCGEYQIQADHTIGFSKLFHTRLSFRFGRSRSVRYL